jgi:ribonuclease HI
MPWVEARLRGQKVFARARADGTLEADGGRVEIRYKKDDPRAYRAAAGNLEVGSPPVLLPEDAVVAGAPAPEKEGAGGAKNGGAIGSGANSGARRAAAAKSATAAATKISKDTWIAYTDGACSGNPGPCGAGVVVVPPGGSPREGFEWLGTGTNNVGELTAVWRALEAIPVDVDAVVHTDSKYAIGVLSQGWKAKANGELIARIKVQVSAHPRARFVYVPGHAGIPLNERADELAREAIRTRRSSLSTLKEG